MVQKEKMNKPETAQNSKSKTRSSRKRKAPAGNVNLVVRGFINRNEGDSDTVLSANLIQNVNQGLARKDTMEFEVRKKGCFTTTEYSKLVNEPIKGKFHQITWVTPNPTIAKMVNSIMIPVECSGNWTAPL